MQSGRWVTTGEPSGGHRVRVPPLMVFVSSRPDDEPDGPTPESARPPSGEIESRGLRHTSAGAQSRRS